MKLSIIGIDRPAGCISFPFKLFQFLYFQKSQKLLFYLLIICMNYLTFNVFFLEWFKYWIFPPSSHFSLSTSMDDIHSISILLVIPEISLFVKYIYMCVCIYIHTHIYTGHFISSWQSVIVVIYKNMPQPWMRQLENTISWNWCLIFKIEKRFLSSYFCAYTACVDLKIISTSILIRISSTVHPQLFQNDQAFDRNLFG